MYYKDGFPAGCEKKPFFIEAVDAFLSVQKGKCPGNNMLGWIDLPDTYPQSPEFLEILETAEKIQSDSEVLVVIGIGGSYMGAKAAIELIGSKSNTEVIFAGNNLSSRQLKRQFSYIENKSFSINVISKSGTTTEPAATFRFLRNLLEEKYGKYEAAKRIYATTDANKGALRKMAEINGYKTFVIPDNVGGRYSVLTAVGLLPMAVAGLDIKTLMIGAADTDLDNAITYAAFRHYCYVTLKKPIENFVAFDPDIHSFLEWVKQLFAESEGKDGKGIWPSISDYTTDLHSTGQMIQEGPRIFFETFICVDPDFKAFVISQDDDNLDNLNYLDGKSIDEINYAALAATIEAHENGNVPCSEYHIKDMTEYELGQLFYSFEWSAAIHANMLGVNAFNQPGVEGYKNKMFRNLGKPGYAEA